MYEKINFKDRIVEKPNTYTVQTNDDGTVTLVPAFGNVLQEGTIINSKNMDHIEEGIKQLSSKTILKENLYVLEGTCTMKSKGNGYIDLTLPKNYTSNNSFVIGYKWAYSLNGSTIDWGMMTPLVMANGCNVEPQISFWGESTIRIYFENTYDMVKVCNIKLLLMKVI